MHYYQFNIADYRKDTAHLSPIEHYIYRQLIDWYYLDEAPIPKKTQSVMRRLSLDTEHEPKLQNVLEDFFEESGSGWVHARIEAEIEKYHANAKKNAANGKKGGRPKKQQVTEEEKAKKTQSVSTGNPTESEKKPNQEPITNNQEPIITNLSHGCDIDPENTGSVTPMCPHEKIKELHNRVLPELASIREMTDGRRKALLARWKQNPDYQSLDWWEKYFKYVSRSDFLMGRRTDFQANFDWIIKPANFAKIIEGYYHRENAS